MRKDLATMASANQYLRADLSQAGIHYQALEKEYDNQEAEIVALKAEVKELNDDKEYLRSRVEQREIPSERILVDSQVNDIRIKIWRVP
jgi:chromosome segregation ATPase